MKKICQIAEMNEDDFFEDFIDSLKKKIATWDYFANWNKIIKNVAHIERELNLLNSLIGKSDFIEEATSLIYDYPQVIKAIPSLIAVREKSVEVLIDVENFIYKTFDFTDESPTIEKARSFAVFLSESGIEELFKAKIKNVVDYVTGVEVGLDSNARKNRTGTLMESIVEVFVSEACAVNSAQYISQATASKIEEKWNKKISIDKSSRKIDFAIFDKNKREGKGELYFIETNFYGGGGSKLKSTAGEYITMNKFWNDQGIDFLWITDGCGWKSTKDPLREYFDKADYLLNLKMLEEGYLKKILEKF